VAEIAVDARPNQAPHQEKSRTITADSRRGFQTTQTISSQPDNGNPEVTRYAYDLADRLIGVRYENGDAEKYGLRGDGARLELAKFTSTPTTFDLAKAIGDDDVPTAAERLAYGYDTADGLKAVTSSIAANSLTAVTDVAGRLTRTVSSTETRQYSWDAAHRMTSATVNGRTSTYSYDWQNWRTRKQVPAVTHAGPLDATGQPTMVVDDPGEDTTFVWGTLSQVQQGETGSPETRDIVASQGLVLAAGDDMFGHDSIGTPVVIEGPHTMMKFHRRDAWGRTTSSLVIQSGVRAGITGHQFDAETGLIYAEQRYLDSSSGRMTSHDPFEGYLAEPLSLQGYIYARANPLRFVDPHGENDVINTLVGNLYDSTGLNAAWMEKVLGNLNGVTSLSFAPENYNYITNTLNLHEDTIALAARANAGNWNAYNLGSSLGTIYHELVHAYIAQNYRDWEQTFAPYVEYYRDAPLRAAPKGQEKVINSARLFMEACAEYIESRVVTYFSTFGGLANILAQEPNPDNGRAVLEVLDQVKPEYRRNMLGNTTPGYGEGHRATSRPIPSELAAWLRLRFLPDVNDEFDANPRLHRMYLDAERKWRR
jgi:RHS repeat-associated protein